MQCITKPIQLCITQKRAQRTFTNLTLPAPLPWDAHDICACGGQECDAGIEVRENVREWDYGDYEDLTTREINSLRIGQGLAEPWLIWRDCCPRGEYDLPFPVSMFGPER